MNGKLAFTKITSSPTRIGWAQAYSAGTLGVLLTLQHNPDSDSSNQDESFNTIGREVLKNIEVEYFSLEVKNLDSLKKIALTSIKSVPHTMQANLTIIALVDNIAYLLITGQGFIFIIRDQKTGKILEQTDSTTDTITASGVLKNNDQLILTTPDFLKIIPHLQSQLSNLNDDTIETLNLKLHETQNPLAACLIATYSITEDLPAAQDQTLEEILTPLAKQPSKIPKISLPRFNFRIKLTRKKLIPIIAVGITIIAFILLAAVFKIHQKNQARRNQLQQFQNSYDQAQKKYSEGTNLLTLNPTDAHIDLTQAQTILQNTQVNLLTPDYADKRSKLLDQISLALNNQANSSNALPVDASQSPLLNTLIKNSDYQYATQADSTIYAGNNKDIIKVSDKTNSVLKNDSSWKNIGGLSNYTNNLYLLDTKSNQIYKFTPSGNDFSKSNYFTSASPDLSSAVSMAIDSSIYVLQNNGTIQKFTRGKPDSFSVKNIDKPLSSPTRIFTSPDISNIYILDNGNSRIITLDKTGTFLKQYSSPLLKSAKDLDVHEKDKKIFFLSGNKLWQVNL